MGTAGLVSEQQADIILGAVGQTKVSPFFSESYGVATCGAGRFQHASGLRDLRGVDVKGGMGVVPKRVYEFPKGRFKGLAYDSSRWLALKQKLTSGVYKAAFVACPVSGRMA